MSDEEYECPYCDYANKSKKGLAAHVGSEHNKYNKGTVLSELKKVSSLVSGTPTRKQFNEYSYMTGSIVRRRFGSWNNGLREANLETNLEHDISRSEIEGEINRVANKLDRTPTQEDFQKQAKFGLKPIERVFGTWNKALTKSGFNTNLEHNIPKADVVEEIRKVESKVNRTPTKEDFFEYAKFGMNPVIRHFGSWKNALEELDYNNIGNKSGPCNPRYTRMKTNCGYCGEEITRKKYKFKKYNNQFCDIECKSAWHSENYRGKNHWDWEGGVTEDYGPNWEQQRQRAIIRDQARCIDCGFPMHRHIRAYGHELPVHHLTPRREFEDEDGNYDYEEGNKLSNLVTLCCRCHSPWETSNERIPSDVDVSVAL